MDDLKAQVAAGGNIYLVDVIEHEGELWLCPTWRGPRKPGEQVPERLIPMGKLSYQKCSHPKFQFQIASPLPQSVLWGLPSPSEIEKYDVRIHPASEILKQAERPQ